MHLLLAIIIIAAAPAACYAFTSPPLPKKLEWQGSKTFCRVSSCAPFDYGLSDDEFATWLMDELNDCPGRLKYSSVYEDSVHAIVQWRKRYRGDPILWKRIFKKDRVIKELIESAPIISAVKQVVIESSSYSSTSEEDEKYTIIDLCSGKGYHSMLLSEILPRDKVERFVMVDKAWAVASTDTADLKPHHMTWDHLYGTNPVSEESYFTTWPIPLYTLRQDLKQSCDLRRMKKRIFDEAKGPIITLAVHLCGTLSIKAVSLFNENSNVKLFALKPCCLPPMLHANRGDIFQIGNHEFDAKDVCSNGWFTRKKWDGPPRSHLQPKFDRWTEHLFKGIDIGTPLEPEQAIDADYRVMESSLNGVKVKDEITIQLDGGFQNTYLFAERRPLTYIWDT